MPALGFKVPKDVSVIGYDNIKISLMLRVPLTVINQPKYGTGKIAANILFKLLEGKKEEEKIILNPELVIREPV